MAVNFLVAFRVTEHAAAPLRRAAEAANLMTEAGQRLTVQARAANTAMVGFAAGTDAVVGLMSAQAAKLEQTLARLATATETTTTTQESSISNSEQAARRFSTEWTASAEDIITAQFRIATAGIVVEEQVDAVQAAFKLAQATAGDFTDAAELLGSFLNTFGKSAEFGYLNPSEKMEKITDRLAVAVQRFQVDMSNLNDSFKFVVGPASTLNLKLAETAAAIGVLNTAGFRGTLAGTALSNMFNKIDRAVEKLDLNPDKFIDLNGNLKDLTSFLEEVQRALSNSTPIEQQGKLIDVFDIRAGRVIKTLLNNIDTLKKFSAELEVSSGATEAMAKIVESTTQAEFQKFLNSLKNISTEIGGNLNVALKSVITFMKDAIVSVTSFVQRNGALIATIVGLTAVLTTLSAIVGVVAVSIGVLRAALTGLAASSALAAIAARILSITLSINKFFLVVGVIIGAIHFFSKGIQLLSQALFGVGDASDKTYDSMKKVNELFGNSIERTSRLASELDRLGKTIRNNVNLPLASNEIIGKLPFAQDATQRLQKDPTIGRVKAIKDSIEAIGGVSGIITQIADSMNYGRNVTRAYFEEFVNLRKATDRQFESLNELEVANEFMQASLVGGNIAIMQMANQSETAAQSIKNLVSIQEKLKANLSQEDRKFLVKSAFENIQQTVDQLLTANSNVARDIAKAFQQKQADLGEEFRSDSGEFFKIFKDVDKLRQQLDGLSRPAMLLGEALRAIQTPIAQVSTSVKSVENLFKNAELGGESFSVAFDESRKRIEDAQSSFNNFVKGIQNAKQKINLFEAHGLMDTPQAKEMMEFIENTAQIEVELRTKIDEANVLRETNRIFALIDRQNKTFTSQQVKDIKELSSSFASVIGDTLTGQIKGATSFTSLADQFKSQFVDSIQKEIAMLFGDRFKDQFRGSIDIARQVIEQAQIGGNLLSGLESGDLANKINSAIQAVIPGIQKITGGDIFKITKDNKLAEQFSDVFTDAAVEMVNAGNRSASLLQQLQDVVSEGPGGNIEAIMRQATELRNLLQKAGSSGADEAIRPIEQALSAVLSQLRDSGPPSAVQQITSATQAATGAIDTSASRFASVVLNSGLKFVETITEGIRRIKDQGFDKISESFIGPQSQNRGGLDIKIDFAPSDLNVTVQQNGGVGVLDEDEIRTIIGETRTEMMRAVDEKINRLERQLRGR